MAILDRLKRGKKTEETGTVEEKKPARAKKSEPALKSEEKKAEKAVVKNVPPKDSTAYRVLVAPLVSEKISRLEKNRQYVFVVAKGANKVEIKKAVEKHYRVHVTGVNVINYAGKNVRTGAVSSSRQDWRKAYVTVREGESITI
jgi:large subunit ribosomal protein L23